MTSEKIIACLFLLQLSLCSFGQTVDVLQLRSKRHFTEKDEFYKDSSINILCEVCYNNPNVIDEEYCRSITFTINDTLKFRNSKILDIEKDTAIIICSYNRLSVWNWNEVKNKITGYIQIISMTDNEIKLDLNIIVRAKEEYRYKGKRTFLKSTANL
jgi:hypothetical protein